MDNVTALQAISFAGHVLGWLGLCATIGMGVILSYQWVNHSSRPLLGVVALCVYATVSATLLFSLWEVISMIRV